MISICFITRLSWKDTNIKKIYQSISSQFNHFYWLVYIEPNTIQIPEYLNIIKNNDERIIINTEIKKRSYDDSHYSQAIDHGFNSQYAKQSNWLYVLDDDNIVHENLYNILNQNNLENIDMIINQLYDKRGVNCINNPQNLSINYCTGHVDWANAVFSSNFFQNKVHHISIRSYGEDGETVRLFIKNNARIYYSNQIAGYYNYLR